MSDLMPNDDVVEVSKRSDIENVSYMSKVVVSKLHISKGIGMRFTALRKTRTRQ